MPVWTTTEGDAYAPPLWRQMLARTYRKLAILSISGGALRPLGWWPSGWGLSVWQVAAKVSPVNLNLVSHLAKYLTQLANNSNLVVVLQWTSS